MILNGNPDSRKDVENGDYCKRMNKNGVDLNRNWGSHWKRGGDKESQTYSGEEPFSEPETKTFKSYIESFKPKVFLTIHSGVKGMYIPFAYSQDECKENHDVMVDISKEINKEHCNCDMGAAGKQVGYVCPGTCLDYAYENLGVPISLAWEIYGSENEDAMIFLEENEGSASANKNLNNQQMSPPSCFLQTGSMYFESQAERDGCFKYFNPTTQAAYNDTVKNWSKVEKLLI